VKEPEASHPEAPVDLWAQVHDRTRHALERGALQPIPTRVHVLRDGGIDFLVREFDSVGRRRAAGSRSGAERDPFGPWEPDLFVADLSASHVCLLNKFNVAPHHVLIVTRAFEDQNRLLGLSDFDALWRGLAAVDGLAFYNAGFLAGASQRHKHLQLVPLPLDGGAASLPVEARLQEARPGARAGIAVADLPFAQALASCSELVPLAPGEAASRSLDLYHALLEHVAAGEREPAYNLLVTRRWMWLVPRSCEAFDSIEVNALGFAGALLVRDREQLERLRVIGPLRLLREVGRPPV